MRRTALALVFLAAAAAGAAAPAPRLRGTFLQLSSDHGQWTRERWEALFADLVALRLDRVYVQWSVLGETAFHPSRSFRTVPRPPLPVVLELAERAGMKVHVGLAHDPAYWEKIKRDPDLLEVYLRRLHLRSTTVAVELAPLLRGRAVFGGWYVTEEIDDASWLDPVRRRLLERYLHDLAGALREIHPAPVAVSGFANAQSAPETLERFWGDLLAAAPVDAVLFQDGIGAGKLDLEDAPMYLAAVERAVEGRGREMSTVVELFRQVGGPPLDAGPFRAVAADPERVRRQLEIVRGTGGAIAFTVPDYMRAAYSGPEGRGGMAGSAP